MGLALCVALVGGVPGTARAAGGAVEWTPCPEDPAVQCGRVAVPVDWSRPAGERISVALARRPALDPARRVGSLLINPGGPGGSGVDFTMFADQVFGPEIVRRFDIVGFDPRGVGRSHPVLCPDSETPSVFPSSAEELERLVAGNARRAQACRRLTGPLFDHVDTSSVVKDLDAIRAALGERRISYYGVSYGTLIGQQYAEQFPGRVRALVLDSNMDHSLTTARRYLLTESSALEESFGQFAAWCRTSDKCALREQGAVKVVDELMAKADKGELDDPENPGTKIPPEELSRRLLGSMYDPGFWPGLGTELAGLQEGARTRQAFREDVVEDPYQAILCADFEFPVRDFRQVRALAAAARRVAPHTRVNPLGWTDILGCKGYLPGARNPQRSYRIKGTPPILVTNGRYDVATPYPWGVNAARQIPDAVLLTYDGVGHGDYFLSACVAEAVDRYLLTVRTPPRGTHCPQGPLPVRLSQRPGFTLAGPR
ncbi:alpha/beta hydrolase [Actinomadura decatromicini]|uniref:Alpha/beta hydrolase n=1 Tax=Actinomadura decatromicini TaxID=2604572 RepID=A0A5D3FPJ7_9ACTN|nr:alpha/beta hydrolase [Actinomadura decatromicini]